MSRGFCKNWSSTTVLVVVTKCVVERSVEEDLELHDCSASTNSVNGHNDGESPSNLNTYSEKDLQLSNEDENERHDTELLSAWDALTISTPSTGRAPLIYLIALSDVNAQSEMTSPPRSFLTELSEKTSVKWRRS